jgi:hypothetical protein
MDFQGEENRRKVVAGNRHESQEIGESKVSKVSILFNDGKERYKSPGQSKRWIAGSDGGLSYSHHGNICIRGVDLFKII